MAAFRLMPAVLALALAAGCAGSRAGQRGDEPTIAAPDTDEDVKIVAEPVGPDALEVYDAEILYQRGMDLFEGANWAEAALYFARIPEEFPASGWTHSARYNLTQCYLNLEDGEKALAAADAFLASLPAVGSDRARLNGRFKRGAALALLERYEEVAALFDELLVEPLSTQDEIEALVDSGIGHYMRGDPYTAEQRLLRARRKYQMAKYKERLATKYFVAQASFYLAQIARDDYAKFEVAFPTLEEASAEGHEDIDKAFAARLEKKCQLLLRAQYLFLRVIREQHLGWASASGYQVGAMYEQLYEELVKLDDPGGLEDSQRELFRTLLEEKVMVLLEKAMRVWQSTADMAVRTGAENEWIDKTRESLKRVKGFVLAKSDKAASEQS
jgi:tetratricopeptide (TPR) repeat protein